MQKRSFAVGVVGLALVACTDSVDDTGEGARPVASTLRPLPGNDEIIAAVYAPGYTVPEGFFVDERANTAGSYSIYHVRDASGTYELCTDDYDQALEWEAADNQSRSVGGAYVGSYENEKYFEFVRELSYPDAVGYVQSPTSPGFARVFKCSMVERDGADASALDGYAGILNARPLTAGTLGDFAEYLWQFTFVSVSRTKVLDSYGWESQEAFEHTLLLATVVNQGDGRCDRIEIAEWIYSSEEASGSLSRTFNFLFAIEAMQENGVIYECG